ncbi:competence protein F homolog [Gracilibacillus boraciitolerans JCM 21714]|uniref:Competence protein F homolog n=1 Tax=Gracilibacillus boraciitolerans JCM 21714 TaxID=1298598 RepID=W4VQC5_9BACI|nr:ComF family protein [Gracilibacillus boraciitolerans]GAE95068.1 competence protein F homolog [Gracilibacillus boraciitolerans JCM 21714]
MNCLYCQEVIEQHVTWSTLFQANRTRLCEPCADQIEKISSAICQRCGRAMKENSICQDCEQWDKTADFQHVLTYNRSLYCYNEFMQEVITKWKYRGDYQLREIFQHDIDISLPTFFPIKDITIVPIPLTEERLYERAFNQSEAIAEMIAKKWNRPIETILKRKAQFSEKQSKKSRKERLNTTNPFLLTKSLEKEVLLVDDIYTTGMTIHHAAKQLKAAGCPKVYSFTLIR